MQLKDDRVEITNNQTRKIQLKIGFKTCINYNISLKGVVKDKLEPIQYNVSYELLNNISNEEQFCEQCVVTNPTESNFALGAVEFTDCDMGKCNATLALRRTIFKYVFGLIFKSTLLLSFFISDPQLFSKKQNK